ncbi:MAG: HlyD family efflux transporter periplasmic adaptor subunit [Oscillatoriales cyanobacterium SM2_1_8]|nr:HlyD family efflux transporter periplasmic adaptor subunit [Oscillatoriales cyanobacterium SM2_1_8]
MREVESAMAALQRAEVGLAQAYIRAPKAGQVLAVPTRVGEKIGDNGIVELGATDRMVAVLEVYQTDVGRVRVGQPATVVGQAFAGEVRGVVSEVGLQVRSQEVASNEPGENLDRRVVRVKVRLDADGSRRVAALTNLQIQGRIAVSGT